jgi:hypothetical protein
VRGRNYIVRFWDGMNLCDEHEVYTLDEIRAIAYACDQLGIQDWTLNGPEFRIEVFFKGNA